MSLPMTGYSGTPLVKKLGIKPGFSIVIRNSPANFMKLLGDLPSNVNVARNVRTDHDMIHFFTKSAVALGQTLPKLKHAIKSSGMIWVSWPKKSSGVSSDVTEDVVRNTAISIGLVDVKVCAIDETWSGLKLVIPVKDRNNKE